MGKKKRHHYIPKTYLKAFCDADGSVFVHLKDAPDKIIHQSPENTAFHRYYYSQPLPGGGRDNNALEDLFSKFESGWPRIVEMLQARQDVNLNLDAIVTFMALQRARVPASRDASERIDAEMVLATAKLLDARGRLPPKPPGLGDILDHVEVAIDPHRSIHAMSAMINGFGTIIDRIGIGALHNVSGIAFLTSDNPVIWFDPSVPDDQMRPYGVPADGPVAFLFPVTPELMIYGHSSMRGTFLETGFRHGELTDPNQAVVMNRQICRFAYDAVFSRNPGQQAVIKEFADVSPVLRTRKAEADSGTVLLFEMEFGKRERKPKWRVGAG